MRNDPVSDLTKTLVELRDNALYIRHASARDRATDLLELAYQLRDRLSPEQIEQAYAAAGLDPDHDLNDLANHG